MKKRIIYSTFIANISSWAEADEEISKGKMLRLLQYSVEQGIRSFKHVPAKMSKANEISFGIAVSESGLDRSEIHLISEYHAASEADFSKQKILDFVDNVLLTLQTDHLDLLMLKDIKEFSEELGEALEQMVFQGKIKEFGIATADPLKFFETENSPHVIELEFSLENYGAWRNIMFELRDEPIEIFIKDFTEDFFEIENEQMAKIDSILSGFESKYNANKHQLLLAWMLHKSSEVHLITDASDELEIRKTTDAPSILFDDGHFRTLKKAISKA